MSQAIAATFPSAEKQCKPGEGALQEAGGHACTGANTRTEVELQCTRVDSHVGAHECLS